MGIPTFDTSLSCDCGAKYERAEVKLPIKDIGMFECQVCGEVVERWHGRKVPLFRLVERPQLKKSNAA